ncbi:MAG: phycobilisome polypeptide [Synechococcaceae bacterium WB9_2_170]|nr:phycobilisome polypeptide [Synechococcaceae bacterium WB9_2_170]
MLITTETKHSEKIKLLIEEACVCGLGSIEAIPIEVRMIVRIADAAKRALSLDEIKDICAICKCSEEAIVMLIEESPVMIASASALLLHKQPELIEPGGELWPEHRAVACWRDCEQFLRVVTYGVACNCAAITDKAGIKALAELYAILRVPVKALLCVLAELRIRSVDRLRRSGFESESKCAEDAFNDLIDALNLQHLRLFEG